MSKILVTGASGFIGSELVNQLNLLGKDVIPINTKNGDIFNPETLNQYLEADISFVFHLAGKTFVPDSWKNILPFARCNMMGTINVVEFCKQKKASLVYVSAYVYGQQEELPISEKSEVKPNNPYALTKHLAENICEFYSNTFGIRTTIIRPFNVIGKNQNENFLIPSVIRQALTKSNIVVEDLSPRRDYIYLKDVVEALVSTLSHDLPVLSTINIGSGFSLSVKEIVTMIQEIAKTNKKVICRNKIRENELNDVFADVSEAQRLLGWKPKTSIRKAIQILIKNNKEYINE